MPPWLIELLRKNNSQGLVDTLSTLVGGTPNFDKHVGNKGAAGMFGPDASGNPTIGLSPDFLRIFNQLGGSGRRGYKSVDDKQTVGDYTLAHEFGHMAASGAKNPQLADELADQFPNQNIQESEDFADHFQNAIQFLRSHSTDTSKLSNESHKIISVILQHEPFKDHPLNKEMKPELRDTLASLSLLLDRDKKKYAQTYVPPRSLQ